MFDQRLKYFVGHVVMEAAIEDQVSITPALLFDERTLQDRSLRLREISSNAGSQLLFALKSLAYTGVLETLKLYVDGFACSSLFEARLAREIGNRHRSIHLTTPGLMPDQIEVLVEECDYISFNSLPQWFRYRKIAAGSVSCALRINPQLPFVTDDRYNPCRTSSKLGVPLDQLVDIVEDEPSICDGLNGIHFHTNCDSEDLTPLLTTVRRLDEQLPGLLKRIEWVNLGGGYLFNGDDYSPFFEAVKLLRSKYCVNVFVEPGAAFVREAGSLISSVVDLFNSDGRTIAVLDTTVNHMPELFEYQCPPEVVGAREKGPYPYSLVGGTCHAGDLFGEFAFEEP